MDTRTLRDLEVVLPGEEPDDLDPADGLPREGTTVTEQLVTGEVWTRALLVGATVARSWFIDADLSSTTFERVTLDRCAFKGCTLVGSQWIGAVLKNVVLENCRLDYATFVELRAVAGVALIGCSLIETVFERCRLNTVALDGCRLTSTRFEACDLSGADLRGNDLSDVSEVISLRRSIVDHAQLPALAEALVKDLELAVR